jgi:pimeloyl-ACP methyl ester carboxylesterase
MKALRWTAGLILLLALVAGGIFYWDPLWVNDQHTRFHLWRAGVRSQYVDAGAYRLHYFEGLPTDGSPGIPLVLVHGLGSRGEDFAPMLPTLMASGFHVYAPDLLGFGRSPHPKADYSMALEETVLLDFMRAINLPRADLIGYSMGGWVVAKLALDHPDMVDRLVFYDSAGLYFQPSFPRTAFVPTDAASLHYLMALLTPKPAVLPPFVIRATLRKVRRVGPIIQQTMDSMESGSDLLDSRLSGITQPTLILWGAEDQLIPVAVGRTMHQDIRNSVFETVSGCGHLAPELCPQPVLAGTIEFLKAQPAPQGGEKTLPGPTDAGLKPATQDVR